MTQKEVAESVGLSEHQAKQAVRVANVPAGQFEAAVLSEKPATVTALAEMGKESRIIVGVVRERSADSGARPIRTSEDLVQAFEPAFRLIESFCEDNLTDDIVPYVQPQTESATEREWLNV